VQDYIDAGVDDDGHEDGEENPEVVEPEALGLVGVVDPALETMILAYSFGDSAWLGG
jgi:hypothetical protein